MEYQKLTNLSLTTPSQSSKFRTRNWVQINDDSRATYNSNTQIKFEFN